MSQQSGFSFIQVMLIALIPALITGLIAYLAFHQQLVAYKRESMAERTARHFLKNKKYTDRRFDTLLKYLGGWDEQKDELRQILVRAGAIRTYRTESNGFITEWWTLLSRMPEKIEKKK